MKSTAITALGQELDALEAETFEITEYADADHMVADGCSTSSTSCSSTTSSCSSTCSG